VVVGAVVGFCRGGGLRGYAGGFGGVDGGFGVNLDWRHREGLNVRSGLIVLVMLVSKNDGFERELVSCQRSLGGGEWVK
jgi:hypothetical protein